jgi:hypothetical protein
MPAFCLKTQTVKLFRFLTDRERLDGEDLILQRLKATNEINKKQSLERRRKAIAKVYEQQQKRNDKRKQDEQAPKVYKHDKGRRGQKSAQSKKPLKPTAYKKGSR